MSKQKKPGGAVGKGGVNPAPVDDGLSVQVAAEQLILVSIDDLVPYVNNARVHSKAQIAQIRASLREFGFVTPVLIDFDNNIIAGHARVEAARAEGMSEVPCVLVSTLTEAQRKAYILADNRLSETGAWDPQLLKLEMDGLAALSFDTVVIGFDAAAVDGLQFGPAEKPAAASSPSGVIPEMGGGAVEPEETEEYRQFVDKFKHKLTTDDCYTPENVYQCVRDWAVEHYGLEGQKVLRPFYPGGDYQNAEYPDGCVVIDNPPFSILSEICRFYNERNIPYFLFAPSMTLFSTASGKCNYVLIDATVTYENGAEVNTSFVTNLGYWRLEIDPKLYQLVKSANAENCGKKNMERPEYIYPPEVLTIAANKLARYGQSLRIRGADMCFIRAMDAQKAEGKGIYGCGFLLSERAAAERAAAERAAAERAAATEWTLSERERQLVKTLGQDK